MKKMVMFGVVTIIVAAVVATIVTVSVQAASTGADNQKIEAVSVINIGTNVSKIYGVLVFTQDCPEHPVLIKGRIEGLAPNTEHGFHVHESGDIRNTASPCVSTGGHFNPAKHDHAAPQDALRHVGDLGNIKADDTGIANIDISDSQISLCGQNSIIGRAVVVHEKKDDLGKGQSPDSKKTGNAGGRIGCGLIGIISPKSP